MDFYYADYKIENFRFGKWRWDDKLSNAFLVIAENEEEARRKIDICIKKRTNEMKRCVLTSDVCLCEGLRYVEAGAYSGFSRPV